MTFDPLYQPRERRAGLLRQRFKQANDESLWFEPDRGIVDADADQATRTEAAAGQPVWDAEPMEDRSPTIPLQIPPPTVPGQVLWSMSQPASNQAGSGTLTQHLSAALYPVEPTAPAWRRIFQRVIRLQTQSPEVLALEIAGTQQQLRFFLRGTRNLVARVFDHLVLSYGGLQREMIDFETADDLDPLAAHIGEGISFAELHLKHSPLLPLRTSGSGEGDDPLLGVFYACDEALADASLPLRVVSQLVLTQAPAAWSKRYLDYLQSLRPGRAPQLASKSGIEVHQIILAFLLLGAMIVFFFVAHGLLLLFWGLVFPLLVIGGSVLLARFWRRWLLSLRLLRHEQDVTMKLRQPLARTCLRLYVLGPAAASGLREAALDRLIAAYGAYQGGNTWRLGKRRQLGDVDLASADERAGQTLRRSWQQYQWLQHLEWTFRPRSFSKRFFLWFGGDRMRPLLSMEEIAALWHFPASSRPVHQQQHSDLT